MDISRRKEALGFEPQRENLYSCFLPYAAETDKESLEYLKSVKQNLCRGLLLEDEQCLFWISELQKFIKNYGLRFSKKDHIHFVNLFYEFLFSDNLSFDTVIRVARILSTLLSNKRLLTREDIQLDWQRPYQFCRNTLYSKSARIGYERVTASLTNTFENLLYDLRTYYDATVTRDMLNEWLPRICPFIPDQMQDVTWYFRCFLPTKMMESEFFHGWKLWFTDVIELWRSCQNSNPWEYNILTLLSRLAWDNRGHIDWSPWWPLIFSRFDSMSITRSLGRIIVSALNTTSESLWSHLGLFFKVSEPYCYPGGSTGGSCGYIQIIFNLCSDFSERLFLERHTSPSWTENSPQSHKLTDADCERFAKVFAPILTKAIFSTGQMHYSTNALHHLALICPKVVIPPVMETLVVSFKTMSEPHRLIPSIKAMTAISRTTIEQLHNTEGVPVRLGKILNLLLDAIDVNDLSKTEAALELIRTLVVNIQLFDISKSDSSIDVTGVQKDVIELSQTFEFLVLNFMSKLFETVESMAPHPWTKLEGRDEDSMLSSEETNILEQLKRTFSLMLLQCSKDIFEKALQKLYIFIKDKSFDLLLSEELLTGMVRACVWVDANATFNRFLPKFAERIFTLDDEDPSDGKIPNQELVFCLSLVWKLCFCPGEVIITYHKSLVQIVKRALSRINTLEHSTGALLLRQMLFALTNAYTSDYTSCNPGMTRCLPNTWGKSTPLYDLNVAWYIPQDADFKLAQNLLDIFLRPQLQTLENWLENKATLTKEGLRRILTIITRCVFGASSALPPVALDKALPGAVSYTRFSGIGFHEISFSDGTNVREAVVLGLKKTGRKLQEIREVDTESMSLTVNGFYNCLTCFGPSNYANEWIQNCVAPLKFYLKNHLRNRKDQIRLLHLDGIVSAHDYHLLNRVRGNFTSIHKYACEYLFTLIESHYEETRSVGISALNGITTLWPEISVILVEKLVNLLKATNLSDEQLSGAMELMSSLHSILGSLDDWKSVSKLWLAFINSTFSGSEQVQKSLNAMISVPYHFDFRRLTFKFAPNPRAIKIAKAWWEDTASEAWTERVVSGPAPGHIQGADKLGQRERGVNYKYYEDLVNGIVDAIESRKLHWKYEELGFYLLSNLIRFDCKFPCSGVRTLTKGLTNSSLNIREICTKTVGFLLQQEKVVHAKVLMNPIEKENKMRDWLQYKLEKNYLNTYVWRNTTFVDKPYWGFTCWPNEGLRVYGGKDHFVKVNRKREELNSTECIIYEFFSNTKSVQNLLKFYTMEEDKETDAFHPERFALFKRLFRNYGPGLFGVFKHQLTLLMVRDDASKQRAACEIIAGLIRGSKHWPLEEHRSVKDYLLPIMQQILTKVTVETNGDWDIFFIDCFAGRDTKRLCWLVNYLLHQYAGNLMENIFYDGCVTSWLRILVVQQSWRGLYVSSYILEQLVKNCILFHDYTDVQEDIGRLLERIFRHDADIKCRDNILSKAPKRNVLVHSLLPQLECLTRANREKEEIKTGDPPSNMLKIICTWIRSTIKADQSSLSSDLFSFLPMLCEMQDDFRDVPLSLAAEYTTSEMASASISAEAIPLVLDKCKAVLRSRSWKARQAISSFILSFVSNHIFFIRSDIEKIVCMINTMLEDDQIEVRQIGGNLLSLCVLYSLVDVNEDRIDSYKRQATGGEGGGHFSTKHKGILCLCAIVDAHPFDVPHYLPDIISFLGEHILDQEPVSVSFPQSMPDTHNKTELFLDDN